MALDFPAEDTAVAVGNITAFSLPNGATINNIDNYKDWVLGNDAGNAVMTAQVYNDPARSLTFQDSDTLLIALSILRADPDDGVKFKDWPNFKVAATECGLYLCVKHFTSNVTNGTTNEQSEEVQWSRNPQSWLATNEQAINATSFPKTTSLYNYSLLYNSSMYYERTDLQFLVPPQEGLAFPVAAVNISNDGVTSLIDYLYKTFDDGSFTDSGEETGTNNSAAAYGITGMVELTNGGIAKFSPNNMQALWSATSLPGMFGRLASSLTNNMRTNSDNTTEFSGSAGTAQVLVRVSWGWIALPCVCTALGSIFLAAAIWETHKDMVPLWKSSALATLFHGFDSGLRTCADNNPLMSQMAHDADGMVVQLKTTRQGGYSLTGAVLMHERRPDSRGSD